MAWDGIRRRDREAEELMAASGSVLRWAPHALMYPLRGGRWLVVLLFGLMFAMLVSFLRSGFFGMFALPALVAWLGLFQRYLFLVVQSTSMGSAVPPNLVREAVPEHLTGALQLLVILFAAGTTWVVHSYAPALTMWVGGFWMLVVPASTLLLASDPRPWALLMPWVMGRLVFTLGPGYLASLACTLGGVALVAIDLGPLAIVPGIYLLVLGHHLLGFQAFTRRDALGLRASFSPEENAARAREAQDKVIEQVLDRVHLLASAGRTQEAVDILKADLPETDDPEYQQSKLLETVLTWRNRELMAWQARRTLTALLDAGRASRALSLMSRCLAANTEIDLKAPALSLALGKQALSEGRPDIAMEILKDLDLRSPDDADAISGSLLYAKTLVEEGKHAMAGRVLDRLAVHDTHPEAVAIKRLAESVAQVPRT
jgi:predicted Zn-dependent protease